MKKILHIVEAFGGGVFTFLVDLVNAVDEEYEIVIAYAKRPQTPENFQKYFSDKVKFVEVKNFTRSVNPIKDLKVFWEIKKVLKEEKPDIVHLHSSKAGFVGRFANNGRKIKMLYNPHGFSFLMQDCSKIKRVFYWLIEKVASFRKCTIVGCSYGEYQEALKLSKNSVCINNGINIDKLKEELGQLEEKKVDFSNLKICTVGRIGFQKNPKLFNEIAESLPNIQFMWIGDGELRDVLTTKNITVTGWKSRKEVLQELNKNDIFMLTSLWEGLPISLLEAMYMKKFCVVSDCIGNRDVIRNGENGYVCRELSNYMEIVENINDTKFYLVNKANSDVKEKYSTDIMKSNYMELYNK